MNEGGKSLESIPSLLCRSQTPDKQKWSNKINLYIKLS